MRTSAASTVPTCVRVLGVLGLVATLALVALAVVDDDTGDGQDMLGIVAGALQATRPTLWTAGDHATSTTMPPSQAARDAAAPAPRGTMNAEPSPGGRIQRAARRTAR
jgi:hypothetical protein